MTANLLIGCPSDSAQSEKMLTDFFSSKGLHIVCGGSTANMTAAYLHQPIHLPIDYPNDLPPVAAVDGLDLVTEGIITLTATLKIIQTAPDCFSYCQKSDGASRLAQILLDQADTVLFFVGTVHNPAHQNPNFPLSFQTKLHTIQQLSDTLQHFGKATSITYF